MMIRMNVVGVDGLIEIEIYERVCKILKLYEEKRKIVYSDMKYGMFV